MPDYKPSYRRQWLDRDEHAKAASLYRDHGLSCAQIAERFGVGKQTVWSVLREAGVKLHGRQRYDGCGGGPVRVLGGGVRTESYRRS